MQCFSTRVGFVTLACAALACSGTSDDPALTEDFPELALTPGRAEYSFLHGSLAHKVKP